MRPPVRPRLAPPKNHWRERYIVTYSKLYPLLKLAIACSLLATFISTLLARFPFGQTILLTLICWSFFVLCTPFTQGGLIVSSLIYLFTGKNYQYTECYVWLSAFLLNGLVIFFAPTIYLHLSTTHVLLYIITHPWPYWLIPGICACSLLYSTFALWHRPSRTLFRNIWISIILKTGAIALLGRIAYLNPIVIAINTHGLP